MINQISNYTPGMRIAALYNRTPGKAQLAFETAGIKEYVLADGNLKIAQDAITSGKPVITDDIELLLELQGIDVIVDSACKWCSFRDPRTGDTSCHSKKTAGCEYGWP